MSFWIGAIILGFLYAFLAMGTFITFRVYDFPDITVDGSFTAGAAVAAILLASGFHPLFALLAAFFIGAVAGSITGLIHTKLRVNGLIAGILVMTGLYSVNLHIMGRSNIPLMDKVTLFTIIEKINPGLSEDGYHFLFFAVVMIFFWQLTAWFFRTDMGLSMRGVGSNPAMMGANGVNVDTMKIFGIALANGMVGVCGALVAQYQGFADVGMGIGTVVVGMASVILGESVFRLRSFSGRVLSAVIGSVLFRLMIAAALEFGFNPIDLKLLTAIFVLIALLFPKLLKKKSLLKPGGFKVVLEFVGQHKLVVSILIIALIGVIAYSAGRMNQTQPVILEKKLKIGVMQITSQGMLDATREGFLGEMKRLGYSEDKVDYLIKNANGELGNVTLIIDHFVNEKVDLIYSISTACTQPAIGRKIDVPIVFGTVANPYIIGAGKSPTDHLPNVTGVSTNTPMEGLYKVTREMLPAARKFASLYDPAHANSEFSFHRLKKAADADPETEMLFTHISKSSEVYEAALSLANKGIDALVLTPDNIVYSALESVVKAADMKKVPVFATDIDRVDSGVLIAYGLDYADSGIWGARMADRILKGTSPADIPIEELDKAYIGLNFDTAKRLGITFAQEFIDKASITVKDGKLVDKRKKE